MLSSILFAATACLLVSVNADVHSRSNSEAVPVELFVMSKCPDAVHCEATFDNVFKKISVPVALDINFIAQPAPFEPLKFSCKHGPSECLGNMQELCYRHVHGDETWFSFIQCLNKDMLNIGTDKLGVSCAEKQGKTYALVRDCMVNGTATELLSKSVQRTASLGVSTSCTVFINNKRRCVYDSMQWKDCPGGSSVDDFVKSIEDAYKSTDTSLEPQFTMQHN
ncbi:hypothetical protein K450DRAFT_239617 [Umbelopsis ramanniana AG]|uniref:Uncharacterized protein n=1 Tax=Umbelopsis ramanniana AG TaxID=1314678 RepID=A0AAD5EAS9_UMBRA|nr:uncharacterized protein K450DRAFT_239617 [Umbelopsis ramanniana AG]KAI8579897.1 hypothetical protein K450DRAFT_239617 [Umbelopsis ramanniana AG]